MLNLQVISLQVNVAEFVRVVLLKILFSFGILLLFPDFEVPHGGFCSFLSLIGDGNWCCHSQPCLQTQLSGQQNAQRCGHPPHANTHPGVICRSRRIHIDGGKAGDKCHLEFGAPE